METQHSIDAIQKPGIESESPFGEMAAYPAKTTFGGSSNAGYCLWEFDGDQWVLKSDRSRPGYVPSAPPVVAGRFQGQLRAVMSVPDQAATAG